MTLYLFNVNNWKFDLNVKKKSGCKIMADIKNHGVMDLKMTLDNLINGNNNRYRYRNNYYWKMNRTILILRTTQLKTTTTDISTPTSNGKRIIVSIENIAKIPTNIPILTLTMLLEQH